MQLAFTPSFSTNKVAITVILAAWFLMLALNAPGHLSYDSIVQLAEGRSRIYGSSHPPLMSALLGIFDQVVPGTGLYLLASSCLFYLALLLVAGCGTTNIMAITALALILVSPVVLIYQGIIWKDVLFANATVMSFALLEIRSGHPNGATGRRLWGRIAGSILCAGAATMVRQNGLVILPFLALTVGSMAPARFRWTWRVLLGLGSLVGTVAVAALASGIIHATAQSDSDAVSIGLRTLQQYDIAGILAHASNAIPDFPRFSPSVVQAFADEARQRYTAERLDYLSNRPAIDAILATANNAEISHAWWKLIYTHPAAYLTHRFDVLRWMLVPPDVRRCLPFHIGVEGPLEIIANLGLPRGLRPGDAGLARYGWWMLGTGLYVNGIWMIAALLLLAVFARLWWRNGEGLPTICLLAAAISFVASFLLIGIACDFRYCYLLPAAVTLAIARLSSNRLIRTS